MTEPTLHEAVESYITNRRVDDLSEETIELYRTIFTGFAEWLESEAGEASIEVEPTAVNRYKLDKTDEKATSTLKTELNVIHRFSGIANPTGLYLI